MNDHDSREASEDPSLRHCPARLRACRARIARLTREIGDLNEILDSQTDMICRFLPDTTLIYVNQAYAAYFSRRPEEMVGTRFLGYVLAERWEEGLAYLKSFTRDNPAQEAEHETVLADGTVRWTWWRDRAVFDGSGNIAWFQSIGRDITKEKLTELALKDAEQRLDETERRPDSAANGAALSDRMPAILSRRERQVARLMAEGKTNKQIATALSLQVPSVKVYATSIFRKLDVRNRTEATALLLNQSPEPGG